MSTLAVILTLCTCCHPCSMYVLSSLLCVRVVILTMQSTVIVHAYPSCHRQCLAFSIYFSLFLSLYLFLLISLSLSLCFCLPLSLFLSLSLSLSRALSLSLSLSLSPPFYMHTPSVYSVFSNLLRKRSMLSHALINIASQRI